MWDAVADERRSRLPFASKVGFVAPDRTTPVAHAAISAAKKIPPRSASLIALHGGHDPLEIRIANGAATITVAMAIL
jgi:hypothetical protein